MPTEEWFKENPKVSAYIPQNLNEKLLDWMKGRNIKKVSQALTAILEEYLGVVQTRPTVQNIDDSRIESLEQKFEDLSQVVQELREAIQIGSLSVAQSKPKQETLPLLEAIAEIGTKQPIEEEIQDDEPDEILHDFLELESQDSAQRTNEEIIKTLKSERSSSEVEQSSSNIEILENEGFKPIMTNAEVSQILNEPINTIRSRKHHNKEFKAKGYRFTPIEKEGKPRWKVERVENEF
jgi:hypothetical protein